MTPKAILYDLDGVLVDACEWHRLSLNEALSQLGKPVITMAEHHAIFNGLPTKAKLQILVAQGRISAEDVAAVWGLKQSLTKKTIQETASLDFDKISLHQFTSIKGIKSACVTNSIGETATMMLEKTGQLPYMEFIINNEMVKNPKPHGEGYIRAMVRLGIMPDECVIVEDSDKGVQAARSTGALVLVVTCPGDVSLKVRELVA